MEKENGEEVVASFPAVSDSNMGAQESLQNGAKSIESTASTESTNVSLPDTASSSTVENDVQSSVATVLDKVDSSAATDNDNTREETIAPIKDAAPQSIEDTTSVPTVVPPVSVVPASVAVIAAPAITEQAAAVTSNPLFVNGEFKADVISEIVETCCRNTEDKENSDVIKSVITDASNKIADSVKAVAATSTAVVMVPPASVDVSAEATTPASVTDTVKAVTTASVAVVDTVDAVTSASAAAVDTMEVVTSASAAAADTVNAAVENVLKRKTSCSSDNEDIR